MANHASAIKRLRQDKERRLRNRYDHKSARTALKQFRQELSKAQEETEKKALMANQGVLSSKLDKLAKKNIIHKNKAAHLKSRLARAIASI
ncbi:30S ribosomal protein S20 [Bacteroidetes bacterium endosymbiont of Geopemphigus sp.]|uniref:30S ribosomal protein S20 n=1 Tax=Bacteroidetes bacterium endosymbiont of Geopemphigus sp. TaxID=2047937 RepID=UPI000CD2111A|nr:30S ribosomal protein S20 [Bacteroidetes bacterium endosymbiont of Geopemphigus sp.]